MLRTPYAYRGMVVAPHHLAAQAGLAVLREGGDAIEAAIATSAMLAVVYPHANGLGGDAFWMIGEPGKPPVVIDGGGAAARKITAEHYRGENLTAVPGRGPRSAITVAGMVSTWTIALALSRGWGGRLPLPRLLSDAVSNARTGVPVSDSHAAMVALCEEELRPVSGFSSFFMPQGVLPAPGDPLVQRRLAATLERLGVAGPDDFYRGDVAQALAEDLGEAGSPVTADDLAAHYAQLVQPLTLSLRGITAYAPPPPTQGLAALLVLGLFERMGVTEPESFAHLHGVVEATRVALQTRDEHVTDPFYMGADAASFLTSAALDQAAAGIDATRAGKTVTGGKGGDTVWFGVIDGAGRIASCMQSLHWEFGSGLVLPSTGVLWHNRGCSFSLAGGDLQRLLGGRRPYQSMCPLLFTFADGRLMACGAMGGDGQPQTQGALFSRYARYHQGLQSAVTAPRWNLGRRWNSGHPCLALENRFPEPLLVALRHAGHDVELVDPFSDIMGHAGAVVRHADGLMEGAADPRADGSVATW